MRLDKRILVGSGITVSGLVLVMVVANLSAWLTGNGPTELKLAGVTVGFADRARSFELSPDEWMCLDANAAIKVHPWPNMGGGVLAMEGVDFSASGHPDTNKNKRFEPNEMSTYCDNRADAWLVHGDRVKRPGHIKDDDAGRMGRLETDGGDLVLYYWYPSQAAGNGTKRFVFDCRYLFENRPPRRKGVLKERRLPIELEDMRSMCGTSVLWTHGWTEVTYERTGTNVPSPAH